MPDSSDPTLRCYIECVLLDGRGRSALVSDDCDHIWHRKRSQETLLDNWMG